MRQPTSLSVTGLASLLLAGMLSACSHEKAAEAPGADETPPAQAGKAYHESDRVSGKVEPQRPGQGKPPAIIEMGRELGYAPPGSRAGAGGGDIALDYVDADVKEICRIVLGDTLGLNYSVDPALQNAVTIRTSRPVARAALLETFQRLLEQNGITLSYRDGLYRVMPIATAMTPPVLTRGEPGSGSEVVPLRYASARQLATMLEPYVADGGRIVPEPERNVLVVTGTASVRENLIDLIRVFDVDFLAGQSYALFPVKSGAPAKVAADLQHFFGTDAEGALAGTVRIIPVERVNAVLVMSSQRAYIERARTLVAELDRIGTGTGRSLHVYFVQNGQAADLQPVLQRAFGSGGGSIAEAGNASPSLLPPTAEPVQINQLPAASNGLTAGGGRLGGGQSPQSRATFAAADSPADNPSPGSEAADAAMGVDKLAIVADKKRNALLVRATDEEYAYVEAALRKLDVLPLQVLIEATVAEVQLNEALQYGTQFFLSNNKYGSLLSAGTVPGGATTGTAAKLLSILPQSSGLTLAKAAGARIQYVIDALRSVTKVKVISSPHLLILDNERARLQVGKAVPILTQSATSILTANAPVVNSVDYHETGVILTVVPRVNSSGLVTLDIEQEVSTIDPQFISGINSPIFDERKVKSRVVVQDGDTVALAGLMTENNSRGNSGIPWLKDLPVLGFLFGQENDTGDRTELLVMITPKIVHNPADARALTEELRRKLAPWDKAEPNAPALPRG